MWQPQKGLGTYPRVEGAAMVKAARATSAMTVDGSDMAGNTRGAEKHKRL